MAYVCYSPDPTILFVLFFGLVSLVTILFVPLLFICSISKMVDCVPFRIRGCDSLCLECSLPTRTGMLLTSRMSIQLRSEDHFTRMCCRSALCTSDGLPMPRCGSAGSRHNFPAISSQFVVTARRARLLTDRLLTTGRLFFPHGQTSCVLAASWLWSCPYYRRTVHPVSTRYSTTRMRRWMKHQCKAEGAV